MNLAKLRRADCAVLLVDFQERLFAAMPPERERVLRRALALAEGALAMALPLVLTEQYPEGLGPTLDVLRTRVPGVRPFPKQRFSAALPEVLAALGERPQVLLAGLETHVCVFQTARDLAAHNREVFVCTDAVLSRFPEDFQAGLRLCERAGATLTTVEAVLFDLLGGAGTPEFKRILAAVK